MRRSTIAFLLALAPLIACAHAIVVATSPAVNAQVAAGPLDIRIRFNSRIDVERSRIVLVDPHGAERAVALSPHQAAGELSGRADVAIAGEWTVRWQVLSVDGHITRGEFAFSVGRNET